MLVDTIFMHLIHTGANNGEYWGQPSRDGADGHTARGDGQGRAADARGFAGGGYRLLACASLTDLGGTPLATLDGGGGLEGGRWHGLAVEGRGAHGGQCRHCANSHRQQKDGKLVK